MAKRKSKKAKKAKVDLRLYRNLTEDEDYKRRFKDQSGGCAICGRPPKKIRLGRDHNHRTGKPRGLLCIICNRKVLGVIERFSIIPAAIVRYLEKFDPENPLLVRKNESKPKTTTKQEGI